MSQAARDKFVLVTNVLVAEGYDADVPNGAVCKSCFAVGVGRAVPHFQDCPGVKALQHIRECLGTEGCE